LIEHCLTSFLFVTCYYENKLGQNPLDLISLNGQLFSGSMLGSISVTKLLSYAYDTRIFDRLIWVVDELYSVFSTCVGDPKNLEFAAGLLDLGSSQKNMGRDCEAVLSSQLP
jgi:hypothetical protein